MLVLVAVVDISLKSYVKPYACLLDLFLAVCRLIDSDNVLHIVLLAFFQI